MQTQHDGGEALAWGAPERVGWFRYFFDDERWEWSPQVAKMHGYPPGTVTPTTDVVLSHKHPDDYRQIADTLALIRQTRQAFSSRHRIRDIHGAVHHVVVVGDQLRNGNGRVIGSHGFYIARGGPLGAMFAELYGRSGGISGGKAGSMHLAAPEVGLMGSSAVVASTIPHAVGAALSFKRRGSGRLALAVEKGRVVRVSRA